MPISEREFEEDLRYMKAKDKGDEEKALEHWFNREALFWACQAIVIAPGKLKERLEEINRREFVPRIMRGNNYDTESSNVPSRVRPMRQDNDKRSGR